MPVGKKPMQALMRWLQPTRRLLRLGRPGAPSHFSACTWARTKRRYACFFPRSGVVCRALARVWRSRLPVYVLPVGCRQWRAGAVFSPHRRGRRRVSLSPLSRHAPSPFFSASSSSLCLLVCLIVVQLQAGGPEFAANAGRAARQEHPVGGSGQRECRKPGAAGEGRGSCSQGRSHQRKAAGAGSSAT